MLRASIMSVAWVTLVVPASAFDLVVVNESNSSVLQKLYIAPAKTKNWSDDKLQNQTVGKNGRFTIHEVSKGIYDLKETDDDSKSSAARDAKEIRLSRVVRYSPSPC
jgi:hypothetical protein